MVVAQGDSGTVMESRKKDMARRYVVWIMGPTSSGKTTIARLFKKRLQEKGIEVAHFDGDDVRDSFGPDFGFAEKDRLRVVQTLVRLANEALKDGSFVVVSALTANQDAREYVVHNIERLIIVSLECGIPACIQRDPKGLYGKAIKGDIKTVIGFNSEYVPPDNPHIVINTETDTPDMCSERLIKALTDLGVRL